MIYKNVKKLRFKGELAELKPKLCLPRESWTKYSEQNREISKIAQGKKSLTSTYACFLTAIAKV